MNLSASRVSTKRGTNPDFDGTKVSQIKKGTTTANELVSLLGQPYTKSVKTATEVEWVYTWAKATAKVSFGTIKTTGQKKNLSVLLTDNVVVNYAYDEGPFEQTTRQGSK